MSRPLRDCRVTLEARPKSSYILKQPRQRVQPREEERVMRKGVQGDLDASTRVHIHTPLSSRRHSRREFRFISFFALEKADFSGIRLQLGSAKGPGPPESSSTSRIPPLRSARLHVAPFSFFNFVGKQSREEQSPDRSRRARLTIATRSTVRNDSVFRRNRGTGAKLNGSNNRTSLPKAESCTEWNVATCRIKARLRHRH